MMGVSHLLVSSTATSLLLGTANPVVLTIGAIAGLLPDVDISTSPAGRVIPWLSHWLEKRFPHRSCTHSFVASLVVALLSYPWIFFFGSNFIAKIHALNIGYLFGWLIDAFTVAGVEMFWPSTIRFVCPNNRHLRLKSGSSAEYALLIVLVALALVIFNINTHGGILTQFNRLIATPAGVEQIYNSSGANHLIIARIEGVLAGNRTKVEGDFLVIQTLGLGFLVRDATGKIYKAGNEADCQIITQRITANVGNPAMTFIETITFDEDGVNEKLEAFARPGALNFLTGEITLDDPDGVSITLDPYQFATVRTTETGVKLESAPVEYVRSVIGDSFATGQLSIRRIITNGKTTTNTSSQTESKEK
jgi:inner membrane protein